MIREILLTLLLTPFVAFAGENTAHLPAMENRPEQLEGISVEEAEAIDQILADLIREELELAEQILRQQNETVQRKQQENNPE